ncbi:MAG: DUF6597 domain-containing transcriptional factor [Bacteroidota bacterium]
MQYHEYQPADALKKYVKCYYSIRCDDLEVVEDKAFATGCVEIMFTLNGRPWQTKKQDGFRDTSSVELWGQILDPLTFKSVGRSEIFGIRFYPATASFLLKEDISVFNNSVLSLTDVLGNTAKELHTRLQDEGSIDQQIRLVDAYLMNKADVHSKSAVKIELIQQVMSEVAHPDFFDNIDNVAQRYGITSRYLQKIFVSIHGTDPEIIFEDQQVSEQPCVDQ